MKSVKIAIFVVFVTSLFFSGCSQDNVTPLSEPVDSVSVDSDANDLQNIDTNGASDGSQDKYSSITSKLKSIYFAFDQFDISDSMSDNAKANAEVLNSDEAASNSIKIEGNCDEWGSDQFNYALGLKRAKSVKEFMISESVSEDRISIVSYGESNGVCSEKTKACWAKNRRVDFKILP